MPVNGNQQQFAKGAVYVNSRQMTMVTSFTLTQSSNSSPVDTMALGYAGESAGSPKSQVTFKSAVPSADFELDPSSFINTIEQVELSIFVAGRTLTIKGVFVEQQIDQSVDKAMDQSFTFRGGPATWT